MVSHWEAAMADHHQNQTQLTDLCTKGCIVHPNKFAPFGDSLLTNK